jgi:hypothetical protein
MTDNGDIRELIREWNISRSSQKLTPITRIRQSSFDVRPESENGHIMSKSIEARIDSGYINWKRPNKFLRKEQDRVNLMRNDPRASSCDPIDPHGLRLSSGDELRGKQAFSLPVLAPPPSIERLRSSFNDTATSSAHRRVLISLHPSLPPGSASPNSVPLYTAAGVQSGHGRQPGGSAASAGAPPDSLGPPTRSPATLTGRLLGTLSRPTTIRRAAAGRQPQAGLCLIWNRGRRPADFGEPERTASEAARRAEGAHAR